MERLSERLTALEAIIRKLEPVESFAKEELDEWLLQNHELAVDDATRMAHEAAAVQPFLNEKRHGKRKSPVPPWQSRSSCREACSEESPCWP